MSTRTAADQASLTERYVHAATRRLPEDQRADVADELRGSIADRVEALVHEGGTPTEAEHTAVVELGDPDRLAAGYSGAPQHLIGPDVFPAWRRVVTSVGVVAVPATTVVVVVAEALSGSSLGAIVGSAVWTAFVVATQIAFWVTLAFALTERGLDSPDVRRSLAVDWTPESLPDPAKLRRGSLGDLVGSVVMLGVIAGALVWQQVASPVRDGADRLPLLDPDLWSFWLPLVLVLLAAEAGFEVAKYRLGGWSRPLAVVNVVLGAAVAFPWVFLAATDRLVNPSAVAAFRDDWAGFDPGVLNAVVVTSALVVWLWDAVDGWRKAGGRRP